MRIKTIYYDIGNSNLANTKGTTHIFTYEKTSLRMSRGISYIKIKKSLFDYLLYLLIIYFLFLAGPDPLRCLEPTEDRAESVTSILTEFPVGGDV